MNNKIIIIAGPTASGKSQLAIDIALAVGGVVINADSQQIYKGTPILSACPSIEDKALVSHRLYEVIEPNQASSVVDWLGMAVREIKDVWEEAKVPVLVGGTGLYIDNLINGTTPIPETDPKVRQKVMDMLEKSGVQRLHEQLKEVDPEAAERLNPNDTTRVRRAVEVYLSTGKTLSEWHKLPMLKKLPEAQFVVVKILPEQSELDGRCYLRFDKMIENGALAEAENVYNKKVDEKLPAMRALGLPELLGFFKWKYSLKEAVEQGKQHSRQYAKRQRTWFANKLNADIVLDKCYCADEDQKINIINNVKKML